jgi:uncharacterized protein
MRANDWNTERSGLDLVERDFRLPRYPVNAPPLRIALLTDLHAGPSTGPEVFRRAAHALVTWQPDLILWGGDYVLFDGQHAQRLEPLLTAYTPKLGSYAVWGNHDWVSGLGAIRRVFQRCGVRILANEPARLPAPYASVAIVGLDDLTMGAMDYAKAWRGLNDDDFRLLLAHNPDSLLMLSGQRADLSLSGHTHGGQIRLPGGYAPYVPSKVARNQPSGLHQTASGPLYISRGIGCTAFPLRINAAPELTLLTLTR